MAMAYCKGPTTALKYSTSLIPGNLAVCEGIEDTSSLTYGVAHKNCINVVHIAAGVCTQEQATFDDGGDKDPASYLTQARWCRLQSSRVVLVLTSYKGFKVLEWNASGLIHNNEFETQNGSFERRFARGVASVGNLVCVGTSEGNILVYKIPPSDGEAEFIRQLQGHSSPICDLVTNTEGELASCDESGMIIVWIDPLTSADSSRVISEPGGEPCISLCFWKSILIGGFANGLIRLYDADSGEKKVEIAAHARCINALDLASDTGLLLSVSEDCVATIWKLPTDSEHKVSQVFSVAVPNSLLCGARFCDSRGTEFALTAYDSREILTYTKSPPQ